MTQAEINLKRWEEIKSLTLHSGLGKDLKHACIMQAIDYVTSGGLSDHPECACPALTSYAMRLNDRLDDENRQRLKPLIPKLVGTRDGKTKERAEFIIHHSITVILPFLCEAIDLKAEADNLRSFKFGEWEAMKFYCREIREPTRAAMKRKLAADAAHAAADAAYAAAHAAADAAHAKPWLELRQRIWDEMISALTKACEIRGDK